MLVPAFNSGQQRLPLPANRCPKSASWTKFTGLYKKTSSLFGVDPYPWQNATLTHDIHKQAEEITGLEAAFKGDAQVGLCTVSQTVSSAGARAFDWCYTYSLSRLT